MYYREDNNTVIWLIFVQLISNNFNLKYVNNFINKMLRLNRGSKLVI